MEDCGEGDVLAAEGTREDGAWVAATEGSVHDTPSDPMLWTVDIPEGETARVPTESVSVEGTVVVACDLNVTRGEE